MRTRHLTCALTAAIVAALGLVGCAPGGSSSGSSATGTSAVSKDVAAAGTVTLTVWDINTDGSANDLQEALNASFEKKYPNVTIKRVERSFNDSRTTLGLALNSPDAPDVVQMNQTYTDMGTFISGHLLRPLDDYAALYGWKSEFPAGQLAINSFTTDGKTWQKGSLWGLSQTGELVGVYYNKKLLAQAGVAVPTTISDFDTALGTVKAAGILPITFGNSEGWPAIHQFGIIQSAMIGAEGVRKLVTSTGGKWTADSNVKAAQMLQEWSAKGYMTPDSGGVTPAAALDSFGKGGSAFYVSGTWNASGIADALGSDAGFVALSPDGSTTPTTMGGIGLAFGVSAACKHTDVAAAYIDWLTNAAAQLAVLKSGSLAAVVPDGFVPDKGVQTDVIDYWKKISAADSLAPYLDSTTTTFDDTFTAAAQELIAQRITPQAFMQALQDDSDKFAASR